MVRIYTVIAIILTSGLVIKTTDLDNLIAETAAYLNILHPDYGRLAARVSVTSLHKETSTSFMDVVDKLYHYVETTGIFCSYQLMIA